LPAPFAGASAVFEGDAVGQFHIAVTFGQIRLVNGAHFGDLLPQFLTFAYKDYSDHNQRKTMTLSLHEFLRRFCLHILPCRFVKIRRYGLLANRGRHQRVE
jgi:hypothetical protein